MTTKSCVNHIIGIIGQEGFGGVRIQGTSAKKALMTFVASNLRQGTDPEKIVRNLLRQRLVELNGDTPEFTVAITPAGAYRLTDALIESHTITPPKSWDGRWHAISYDLPASKKAERYQLVKHIRRLGFFQLQGSIWVHPYPCEETIKAVAEGLGLMRYLTLMEIAGFDPDTYRHLNKHFAPIGVRQKL